MGEGVEKPFVEEEHDPYRIEMDGVSCTPVLEAKMKKESERFVPVGYEMLMRRDDGSSIQEWVEQMEREHTMGPFVQRTISTTFSLVEAQSKLVHAPLPIAVNIPLQELHGETVHLLCTLAREKADLVPHVELEITEREAFTPEHVAALEVLKHAGYHITLDDFDTAFCNMELFNEGALPELASVVDTVKIDKQSATTDPQAYHAMLQTLREMGFQVVIEGVEDLNTQAQLADSHITQGYAHGQAKTASAFLSSLEQRTTDRS